MKMTEEELAIKFGVAPAKLGSVVKALEYHPDGSLKRVEFVTPVNHAASDEDPFAVFDGSNLIRHESRSWSTGE